MSDPTSQPARRRRRPWRAMLPTLVVLGLGLVWSLAWFIGAWWLERGIAEARAAMVGEGVSLECSDDGISGYPFRFTFDCVDAVLTTPDATVALTRIAATVQAYDPRYMIAELQGPARIIGESGTQTDMTWERLLVSARTEIGLLRAAVEGRDVDPLRIVTEFGLTATDIGASFGREQLAAARLAAFARPALNAASRDVEIAVDIDEAGSRALSQPIDVILRSRLFALPRLGGSAFFEDWLGAGGSIGLTQLDLANSDAVMRASGQMSAPTNGAVEAEISVGVVHPGALPGLVADADLGGLLATIANAFLLVGRPIDIDGQDALALDVTVRDGNARIGILPIGALPPLF